MKTDPGLVKNFTENHKIEPTCAVRHIQTDTAVSVHQSTDAASLDCGDRNSRAKTLGVTASYDVQPL